MTSASTGPASISFRSVVAFRGTEDLDEWITVDAASIVAVDPPSHPDAYGIPGAKVGQGFSSRANNQHRWTHYVLHGLNCKTISVTGHSLGAAASMIWTDQILRKAWNHQHNGVSNDRNNTGLANKFYDLAFFNPPHPGNETWLQAFNYGLVYFAPNVEYASAYCRYGDIVQVSVTGGSPGTSESSPATEYSWHWAYQGNPCHNPMSGIDAFWGKRLNDGVTQNHSSYFWDTCDIDLYIDPADFSGGDC